MLTAINTRIRNILEGENKMIEKSNVEGSISDTQSIFGLYMDGLNKMHEENKDMLSNGDVELDEADALPFK